MCGSVAQVMFRIMPSDTVYVENPPPPSRYGETVNLVSRRRRVNTKFWLSKLVSDMMCCLTTPMTRPSKRRHSNQMRKTRIPARSSGIPKRVILKFLTESRVLLPWPCQRASDRTNVKQLSEHFKDQARKSAAVQRRPIFHLEAYRDDPAWS